MGQGADPLPHLHSSDVESVLLEELHIMLTQEVLDLAQQYDLYVTAGSDYHGTNKTVLLGSVPLPDPSEYPQGLKNFLSRIYHP